MAKSPLRRYMDDEGLSSEQVAARLSEKLGEEIGEEQIAESLRRGYVTKPWAAALEIETRNPRRYRDADDGTAPQPGEKNPRRREPDAPPVDEFDWYNAREAIIAIYVTVGVGVAKIRRSPRIEEAFKQGAPVLADDWIALARVDARTRAVLAKMMVAGPSGKLAMDHVVLIGKILSLEKPAETAPQQMMPRPEVVVDFAADGPPVAA